MPRSSTPRPRTFFRGTNPGDTRRISTGNARWDSRLFCSSSLDQARAYGREIERIEALPEARILYEGTMEFRRVAAGIKGVHLLDQSDRIAAKAEELGYDAVWFRMQGNIGTVIMNRSQFHRGLTAATNEAIDEHEAAEAEQDEMPGRPRPF